MLNEHAKLLAVFETAGVVTGRKKLQKMLYILKKMKYPFQQKYQFHVYGPYSEELTLQVEELCELGFVQEEKEQKSGFYQYRYELTGQGRGFLQNYQVDTAGLSEYIQLLNSQSARFLELVSTLLFFDNLPDREKQIEKVNQVKQKLNFTNEEFGLAFTLIDDLKTRTENQIQ